MRSAVGPDDTRAYGSTKDAQAVSGQVTADVRITEAAHEYLAHPAVGHRVRCECPWATRELNNARKPNWTQRLNRVEAESLKLCAERAAPMVGGSGASSLLALALAKRCDDALAKIDRWEAAA